MKWIPSLQELLDKTTQEIQGNSTENELLKTILSTILEEEAQLIKDQTDLEVANYSRVIDNYAIKHVIKNHGNPQTEKQRGQIAIEITDFEKIDEITQNPDKISYEGKNDTGRDTIKYQKSIAETLYLYLEEVRTKRKELAMNTLYKRKKPSD